MRISHRDKLIKADIKNVLEQLKQEKEKGKFKTIRVYFHDINWDGGRGHDLPVEINTTIDIEPNEKAQEWVEGWGADWLSDNFGFTVNDFSFNIVDEYVK